VITKFCSSLLPDTKAAQRLPFSVHTLRWWRRTGRGPTFVKIGGRVFYYEEDIDAWLAARPRGGEVVEGGRA
jgi:predicted site-specific integrase-resolvase